MADPKKITIKNEFELTRYVQTILTWHNHIYCKNTSSERAGPRIRIIELSDALSEEKKYKNYAKTLFEDKDSEISQFMAHMMNIDSMEIGILYDYSLWRTKLLTENVEICVN